MSESDDETRDPAGPSDSPGPSSSSGAAGDVGSVGEEAAKLLGALAGWAREQAPEGEDHPDHPETRQTPDPEGAPTEDLRTSLGGLAAHLSRTWRDIDQHVATGAPECLYCPLCRTVHVVRSTSPEVRAHLATAAGSLLEAGLAVLGSLPTGEAEHADPARRGRDVHHIDLDDGPDPARPDASHESGHRGPEEQL